MERDNRYDCFDECAERIIRKKARQLKPTAAEDAQDIEQELATQLWRGSAQYDSARSSLPTFLTNVADRKLANIATARKAQKRSTTLPAARPCSDAGSDAEPAEVIDISDMRAVETRRQRRGGLHIDLKRAIKQLSAEEHELCRRLMADTVSEVAEDIGKPRSTVYGHIAKIRRHFEREGLRPYLKSDGFRPAPVRTGRRQ